MIFIGNTSVGLNKNYRGLQNKKLKMNFRKIKIAN
jgi:hypothetical protein